MICALNYSMPSILQVTADCSKAISLLQFLFARMTVIPILSSRNACLVIVAFPEQLFYV